MTLGETVHAYRKNHGISMEEFARLSKLSKGYISMLEKDKNPRTGKPIIPSIATYNNLATAMNISPATLIQKIDDVNINTSAKNLLVESSELMGEDKDIIAPPASPSKEKTIRIPILGRVAAGNPIGAIEEIIGWEEIPKKLAAGSTCFALRVCGRSMEPRILAGDTVIIRQQPDVDSGDIAVVLVGGEEATVKRVKKQKDGIILIATNTTVYEPHFYSNQEIKDLPIQILGKVVEVRYKP